MQNFYKMPLHELCARLVELSGSFVEDLPINVVAADELECGSLRRTLDGMNGRGLLSRRDNADLDNLSAVLGRELDRETEGWTTVFDGHYDPDLGNVGEPRRFRELTERGRMIEGLSRRLREIARMRKVCRARIDAEDFLMRR